MDLVLFIIILCFRCSSDCHSYTALKVLSALGMAVTFVAGFFAGWPLFLDCAWYLVNLLLACTAENQN